MLSLTGYKQSARMLLRCSLYFAAPSSQSCGRSVVLPWIFHPYHTWHWVSENVNIVLHVAYYSSRSLLGAGSCRLVARLVPGKHACDDLSRQMSPILAMRCKYPSALIVLTVFPQLCTAVTDMIFNSAYAAILPRSVSRPFFHFQPPAVPGQGCHAEGRSCMASIFLLLRMGWTGRQMNVQRQFPEMSIVRIISSSLSAEHVKTTKTVSCNIRAIQLSYLYTPKSLKI
ncbi:uncharacterized protein MYCFIDRAFT_176309 [Pseudocercospora fijiensis CIRAD86]|uniref:Uncharacterized protein n=1 Tax=Pseudocercospora fijiensis (strain CIRAD86) TaxID=383855 RepID=M2YT86_PSEFD|nr:uncharacterized protein MYCFIDRAFT_176309 [Pseudocercospora fijiensis CIRAD86]EME80960.1 hypothetical protein MYCFIDRAFT_176309 [Pseudocercospora fijiensis CIRAD86]